MSKQIALIRLLDLENWLRGVTFWDFPATCTSGQFKCGEVFLANLAPHLCCREFESADPLFVEFEAEGNESVPYTAVTKLYARDQISQANLQTRYPYWPCDCISTAVVEAIVAWKREELLADALLGGSRLGELCASPFTPTAPEENLTAWIDYIVRGTVAPALDAPLISHVLAYSRHKPMSNYMNPFTRAIVDIGTVLVTLSSPRVKPYVERLRDWLQANHARETAPDFEVNALSFLQKMRLRPEACGGLTSLAPLALYMQWIASLADYKQADFAALRKHLAQMTAWGFGEEAAQALWLFGCRIHASNFASEYIRWWQTRKGVHLPVSPFFCPEELPSIEAPHPEPQQSEAETEETVAEDPAVDESVAKNEESSPAQISKPSSATESSVLTAEQSASASADESIESGKQSPQATDLDSTANEGEQATSEAEEKPQKKRKRREGGNSGKTNSGKNGRRKVKNSKIASTSDSSEEQAAQPSLFSQGADSSKDFK